MGLLGYKPESKAIDGCDSLSDEQMETILLQSKKCICKITVNKKKVGTGFFCALYFPDKFNLLRVLITCNHVLDEDCIAPGKEINYTLNNDKIKKSIVINKSRKFYTSKEKDITIIEIDPKEDNISDDSFLNVDENIIKEEDVKDIYENKSVYIIHYEDGKKKKNSPGIIKSISEDKFNITHNCATKDGSSGGPIITLENYGVMGIHKGTLNKIKYGTLLKIPIDEFYEMHKNSEKKRIIKKVFSNQKKTGNFYVSYI